jgi:hypothetical protein
MRRSPEADGLESVDPQVLQRLAAEGEAAFSEYERSDRPEVLEVAVAAFQHAVEAALPGHPARAGFLSNLGMCLYRRFERAGRRTG